MLRKLFKRGLKVSKRKLGAYLCIVLKYAQYSSIALHVRNHELGLLIPVGNFIKVLLRFVFLVQIFVFLVLTWHRV